MPDVTLCQGGSCGLRHTCSRFLAAGDKSRQSYFATLPATFDGDNGWECEYYDSMAPVVDEEDDAEDQFPLF